MAQSLDFQNGDTKSREHLPSLSGTNVLPFMTVLLLLTSCGAQLKNTAEPQPQQQIEITPNDLCREINEAITAWEKVKAALDNLILSTKGSIKTLENLERTRREKQKRGLFPNEAAWLIRLRKELPLMEAESAQTAAEIRKLRKAASSLFEKLREFENFPQCR